MRQIHILIVDESPDFAKSLGSLINDVFGEKSTTIDYAFNIQDGLKQINNEEFHFAFLRVNFSSNKAAETKLLFRKVSLNPTVEIITLTFNNESVFIKPVKETEVKSISEKDEVDIDELAMIFEIMK